MVNKINGGSSLVNLNLWKSGTVDCFCFDVVETETKRNNTHKILFFSVMDEFMEN